MKYLNTQQAAAYVNVSVSTFRQHVAKRVQCRRIGRKPLYATEDLDRFMTIVVEEQPLERRPSQRRGSAHASARQDKRAKSLSEQLERRTHGT